MQTILKVIAEEMAKIGVDYYDMINTSGTVTYPYITGEFTQSEYDFEDGHNRGDLLMDAWNRGSRLDLVKINDKIKDHFRDFRTTKDGMTIHISYMGAVPIRTNDDSLKRLQINLDIHWWEGV